MKNILIIGATSAIAMACARLWAEEKANFYLVARNEEKLQHISDDLRVRGATNVYHEVLDVNDIQKQSDVIQHAWETLSRIDSVLIAHGTLPNQPACENSVALTMHEITTNGLSVVALLTLIGNKLAHQQHGTIAVITSVAGDRGRPSNYVYGAAKSLVATFCEGLRARLFKSGVHVLTIKPGFVDTPMTQGLSLPKRLVVSPQKIAVDINRAMQKRKNLVYTPWFWQWIMRIICMIPGPIFKRLSL